MNQPLGRNRTRNAPLFAPIVSVAVLWSAVAAWPGTAAESGGLPEYPWSLSARWENDIFAGTDRFYTDGVSLSLAHTGRSWLDGLANRLPWGEGRRTASYELGQIMITPQKTSTPIPDPNDRPYAGILYAALSLHVERDSHYHGLKLIGGVIGPWSLAEQTQKQVHRWTGSPIPKGWDAQLHNEPVLNLVYEHLRRFALWGTERGMGVEALPVGNVMLGNVLIQGQVGTQVRFGYNLPRDFGTTLMRGMVHLPPPCLSTAPGAPRWGTYLFGGGNVNLVARNITLDGNTWKDSPSVNKEWFVPAAEFGVSLWVRRFTTSFAYVVWAREFKAQPEPFEFGAVTVSYRF